MLRLVRVTEHEGASFGVLTVNDSPEFVTCELAWRNNDRGVSCIPQGRYKVRTHRSPKFGLCLKVLDVPERSEILIHVGNTIEDTSGCILVGQRYGTIDNKPAILGSRVALNKLLQFLTGLGEVDLVVISAYGGGRVH